MTAQVLFVSPGGLDQAILSSPTFLNASNVATDPTSVTCTVTDPTGTTVTHSYLGTPPADITKISVGNYSLLVSCTLVGLWGFEWLGSGNGVSEAEPGTFTVNPGPSVNQQYTSVEELKDRLGITTTATDLSCLTAVQAASRAVEGFTGRFFYQITETRTFVPYDIWEQPIDDLVSITALNVDSQGTGTYDQAWVNNTDYQLAYGIWEFNQLASGEPRPFTQVRVINGAAGGKFFPFIWPFAPLNRVQVIGTWGWPQVPWAVKQATLQVAAEFFKLKDAPFGIAGTAEFGVMRIPKQNPYIQKLLTPYIHPRRKVGV